MCTRMCIRMRIRMRISWRLYYWRAMYLQAYRILEKASLHIPNHNKAASSFVQTSGFWPGKRVSTTTLCNHRSDARCWNRLAAVSVDIYIYTTSSTKMMGCSATGLSKVELSLLEVGSVGVADVCVCLSLLFQTEGSNLSVSTPCTKLQNPTPTGWGPQARLPFLTCLPFHPASDTSGSW